MDITWSRNRQRLEARLSGGEVIPFSESHFGICASLAPCLAEKFLAANVIVFMFMTIKAGVTSASNDAMKP